MAASTIQIFLPDGNPRGLRIAKVTTRNIEVLQVPRVHLDDTTKRPELSNVGIYFLFGNSDEDTSPIVYIGEAEDVLVRLSQHNKTKDFWQWAFVCISRAQEFTKVHVKYLEWLCHQTIEKVGRFQIDNKGEPTCPHISEALKADLADYFDTIRILTSTLGFPFLEDIEASSKERLLHCNGKDAEAKGKYLEDGLVVYKGSTANLEEAPASKGTWVAKLRQTLVENKTLVQSGKVYIFTKNHIFNSPSAAAVTVLGRYANGWKEWKYENGKTLDEEIRQNI
ncbi:MAG TPA: DUF4357 domain-containing protein [Bacteroidetes bacterium]|jgi:hypothetical protein|nr:DUF4357 domain-containing protein [Bacteroidota bacterium]